MACLLSVAMVAAAGANTSAWASGVGQASGLSADAAQLAPAAGVPAADPVPPGVDTGGWPKNSYASTSMVRLDAAQTATAAALQAAQRDNKEVPIPELTTETIQAWARPDGTIHEETAAAPVRAKINGAWQGVDATLVQGSDGAWRPKVSPIAMAFSGGGSGPMARLARDGVEVAYTFPEKLPTPSVDGASLTYPNVYPDVDLVLTATSSTFSQVLVVKDKAAAKNPKVRTLRLKTAVTGGSLTASKDGGYAITNSKGAAVLRGAAPLAWDSAGVAAADASGKPGAGEKKNKPEPGRKAGHPAPGVGNRQQPMKLAVEPGAVTVQAPAELLDDPATVFPVSLDPTVYLANTRWFMVDSAYPNQQYANYTGSASSAWGPNEAAGYNDYAGVHVKRLFFEFTNARLVGKNITYATFNAFQASAATCDTTAGNNAYILNSEIATPVTWNSQPSNMTTSYGTYTAKTNPSACNNGKLGAVWDITAAVKGRQGGGAATTTVVLKGSNEASNSSWQRWLDPTTGTGNAPILAFDYTYDNVPALADLTAAAPGVGMQSWYGIEEFTIRENLSLGVNVANGNVIVRDTDLKANAPGIGVRLDRWYNSASKATGTFGQGWKSGLGSDVRLVEDAVAGTVYFVAPSGFITKWVNNSSGGWTADPGLNASLRKYSDGTYRVTAANSGATMDFGASGMLANFWDAGGIGLAFAYNGDGTTRQIVDAAGRRIDYSYSAGRAATITQTGTDGTTRATSYSYNASGRLASSKDLDGNVTSYGYDGAGRLGTISTARGVKLTIAYDASGRAVSVSRWDDAGAENKTMFAYTSGTQTVQTDPTGGTWIYTLDGQKRLTSVADPYRNKTSRSYTANNTVATSTDAMGTGGAGGNVTTFSWDANNNPTQVKAPTGATTTLAYGSQPGCGSDGSGAGDKVTCLTDPAGNKTGMTWDATGNLTSSTAGSGSAGAATTSYTYQATSGATGSDTACGGKKGQLCTATQPVVAGQSAGWKVTNGYDSYGNLTSSTGSDPALLGARTFSYDGFGRVKTATDGTGQTLTYAWDNRDHVTGVSGAKSISYGWDADGNQTGNDGAIMTYDKANRQTAVTVAGKTTRASYEANGNLASFTDDTGAVTTYSYFWHNRVAAIAINGASCAWGRANATAPGTSLVNQAQGGCVKFAYNNNGAETGRVYPGGVIQTSAYDNSARTTAISSQLNNTGALLTSQGYGYTGTGAGGKTGDQANVMTWTTGAASLSPGPANGAAQSYSYDTLNRVKTVTETGATAASWSYAWDPMGNRTSLARTGATGATGNETATYNKASMLTANSYGAFSYDKNGAELSAPAGPTNSGVPARTGEVTDPVGNVTSMTVNGTTLPFGYGGANPGMYNQLLSAHGSTYHRSILGLALSSQVVGGKTVRYITHPSGTNIGYVAPEGQAWFLTDRLGSIIALASDTGALIASYSYDPTGIPRATVENTTLAGYNIHRYHGGLLDKTTGLTRYGVRWHNPATARFTTPDPSGKETNPYLYAAGNTCNTTDPNGEGCGFAIGMGVASVIGLGASLAGMIGSAAAEVPTAGASTVGLWISVVGFEASAASLVGSISSIRDECR